MSVELIAAVVIVILSSTAFVAAGTLTNWDLLSKANVIAMRIIGATSVVALMAVVAWSRRSEPLVAAAALAGGFALAAGYVRLHIAFTRKVAAASSPAQERTETRKGR